MERELLFESYDSPKVEVMEVEVEKGFATSGGTEGYGPWQ